MHYFSGWLISSLFAIVSLIPTSPAIAHPRPGAIPAHLPSDRLARDLTRFPSEDFFRQGQARLEREIQLLTKNRALLTEDLLQVSPDGQLAPEELEQSPPINPSQNKRSRL